MIEWSTGRHAFGLMVSKAQVWISPKAGPNVFWNAKYGSGVAEVGGGYGMLGRLLPEGPVEEPAVSATAARSIAEEAVKGWARTLSPPTTQQPTMASTSSTCGAVRS